MVVEVVDWAGCCNTIAVASVVVLNVTTVLQVEACKVLLKQGRDLSAEGPTGYLTKPKPKKAQDFIDLLINGSVEQQEKCR